MYAIYANIGGILMVNVTIYSIHGSYGYTHLIWTDYESDHFPFNLLPQVELNRQRTLTATKDLHTPLERLVSFMENPHK